MRKASASTPMGMHPLMKENYLNVIANKGVILQELYTTKSKSGGE
jgi:hypothetical protein